MPNASHRSPFAAAVALAAEMILLAPLPAFADDEARTYRCEAKGGPAWREYRSSHFLLATDVKPDEAARLVADLEALHALVVQALVGEVVEIPGRVRVIAFDRQNDFRAMTRDYRVGGYFTPTTFFQIPIIVLHAASFEEHPTTVAHELAHHVSSYVIPHQPLWLAEGMAHFIGTVGGERARAAAKGGAGAVEVSGLAGLAQPHLVSHLREHKRGMPEDLLTWSGWPHAQDAGRYHVWSWLLYHWLWDTRYRELAAFTDRLSNGEEPMAAWRASFPDLDPSKGGARAKLEGPLLQYASSGEYRAHRVTASADARFTVAPLSSAEVHYLLLDARQLPPSKDEVRAELEEILREDPQHPVAVWRSLGKGEDPAPTLREMAAARPGDWRAWLLLADALGRDANREEKETALRKAAALAPDVAVVRNALAWFLMESGRAKEALPHANAALDLAPWSPSITDTLAVTAAEMGKCAEARVLQRRALGLVVAGSRAHATFEQNLARIEKRCADAPPGAASRSSP